MSSIAQDELIKHENRDAVVIATIINGTFREEKRVLEALERLGNIIDARKNVKIVLDMMAVEYLSSAGLGRLVALLKKAMGGGGSLHISTLRPEILELFEVMRLGQIFKIFDNVEEAVGAFEN